MTPAAASARARATSASSMAASSAWSLTAAATGPRARIPAWRPPSSGIEECRLVRSLEVDVEPIAVGAALGDKACPLLLIADRAENGVGGIGGHFVCEVDPGRDGLQQAAGEDQEVDARRLVRGSPRLEGEDCPPPDAVGRRTGKAAEAGDGRPMRRRLPRLDEGICHRFARAVEDPAPNPDRARRPIGHGERPVGPRKRDGEVQADRLRRRSREPHSVVLLLERRLLLAAAEHDVEPIRERPLRPRLADVEPRDEAIARLRRDGVEDRVLPEEWIAWE